MRLRWVAARGSVVRRTATSPHQAASASLPALAPFPPPYQNGNDALPGARACGATRACPPWLHRAPPVWRPLGEREEAGLCGASGPGRPSLFVDCENPRPSTRTHTQCAQSSALLPAATISRARRSQVRQAGLSHSPLPCTRPDSPGHGPPPCCLRPAAAPPPAPRALCAGGAPKKGCGGEGSSSSSSTTSCWPPLSFVASGTVFVSFLVVSGAHEY